MIKRSKHEADEESMFVLVLRQKSNFIHTKAKTHTHSHAHTPLFLKHLLAWQNAEGIFIQNTHNKYLTIT